MLGTEGKTVRLTQKSSGPRPSSGQIFDHLDFINHSHLIYKMEGRKALLDLTQKILRGYPTQNKCHYSVITNKSPALHLGITYSFHD